MHARVGCHLYECMQLSTVLPKLITSMYMASMMLQIIWISSSTTSDWSILIKCRLTWPTDFRMRLSGRTTTLEIAEDGIQDIHAHGGPMYGHGIGGQRLSQADDVDESRTASGWLKGVSQLWMRRRLISHRERRWMEAHICWTRYGRGGFQSDQIKADPPTGLWLTLIRVLL
jgi:hypothetical protein